MSGLIDAHCCWNQHPQQSPSRSGIHHHGDTLRVCKWYAGCICWLLLVALTVPTNNSAVSAAATSTGIAGGGLIPVATTALLLLSLTPPAPFGAAVLTGSPSHSNSGTSHTDDDTHAIDSSYLLLCLTDGRIVSLQAWTGEYQSVIHTQPLLQSNYYLDETNGNVDNEKGNDSSNNNMRSNMIFPGLDGRLYWRPPATSHPNNDAGASSSSSVADQYDAQATSDSPRGPRQQPPLLPPPPPPLEELPLTVTELLENPVRSCDPDRNGECSILTAQAVTSLLAISSTGKVVWQSSSDTSGANSDGSAKQEPQPKSPLLLQRKDYWVNHVHATTGHTSWNVSLGTYQALDFEPGIFSDLEDVYLLDNDDDPTNNHPKSSQHTNNQRSLVELPSIVFANAGKTITAVDPATNTVLWRQDVPSTLAAVFGIHQGQWKTVPVIPETSTLIDQGSKAMIASPILPELDATLPSYKKAQFSDYEQLLWKSQQQLWAENVARKNPKAIGSGDSSLAAYQQRRAEECRMKGEPDDTCPNRKINLPLQLPSPPTVPITVHAEGLLLSWSLVGVILGVLTTAIGSVRFWYLRKKYKWVTESAVAAVAVATTPDLKRESRSERPFVRWDTATTVQKAVGFSTSNPMKRSRSLPGTMATDALMTEQMAPLSFRDKSEAVVTDDTKVTRTNSADSAMERQRTRLAEQIPPIAVDYSSLGVGIPLVRYSRYASEFEELQALGKGGFGSVYCCKNTLDRRDYAVKKVSIRCSSVDEFQQQLQRVLREVKILAVLDHPNIVRYYAAWLEMEDKKSQQQLHREVDGDNTSTYETLSRRHSYSSSQLLTTDSVSEWETGPQNRLKRQQQQQQSHVRGKESSCIAQRRGLYSNTALEYTGDSSSLPRRRSLRHVHGISSKDDLMIFEDSKEDGRDSSTEDRRSRSQSLTRDQSTISRRRDVEETSATTRDVDGTDTSVEPTSAADGSLAMTEKSSPVMLRHTLYIQMQLCSQGTVADYLSDPVARRGLSTDGDVDIPKALRLFLQIAEATQYVHRSGLIHRDLKPSNCFMDDSCSTVKVGDFGLSRESSSDDEHDNIAPEVASPGIQRRDSQEDHTAGVGTRSYASPEQMNGSDYDSSTDVYSLGIIFFELLYPMHTGMERHICLSNLRSNRFPKDWDHAVGDAFPTLKDLLISMLSCNPTCRPNAVAVTRHIQSILGEFTIVSLDQQHYRNRPDTVLLRIEAAHCEDALQHTMQLIRDESSAANDAVDIVQYGMRSGTVDGALFQPGDGLTKPTPTAIMEFALRYNIETDDDSTTTSEAKLHVYRRAVTNLVYKLIQQPQILKVRQVSDDPLSSGSR